LGLRATAEEARNWRRYMATFYAMPRKRLRHLRQISPYRES